MRGLRDTLPSRFHDHRIPRNRYRLPISVIFARTRIFCSSRAAIFFKSLGGGSAASRAEMANIRADATIGAMLRSISGALRFAPCGLFS